MTPVRVAVSHLQFSHDNPCKQENPAEAGFFCLLQLPVWQFLRLWIHEGCPVIHSTDATAKLTMTII